MINPNMMMVAPNQYRAAMQAPQAAAQAPIPQAPMPQAAMPQQSYGLQGSEAALGSGYQQAMSNLLSGVGNAETALLQQSDLGRQRLNAALQQSQNYGTQALDAIKAAGGAASGAISSGIGSVTGAFDEGVSALRQFLPQGVNAFNQIAKLAGGDYSSYNESPDMKFLREQGERSVLQNARAAGGVGGNVLKELQRYGTGVASQGFNDYFNRLKGVADMGYGASQGVGSLRGQQAGIVGNLSAQQAQNAMQQGQLSAGVLGNMGNDALNVGQAILGDRQNLGANLGNLYSNAGGTAGDYALNIGNLLSGGRLQAGRDIAGIQQAQGQGLSNVVGGGASNLAQLLSGIGDNINSQQGNYASLLAGLATNTANQGGNQTSSAQFLNNSGIMKDIAALLQGAGTAAAASDFRLKENIRPAAVINGINFYHWDWNEAGKAIAGDQIGFGVIAQELINIKPEAVTIGDDGYLRVNYKMVI